MNKGSVARERPQSLAIAAKTPSGLRARALEGPGCNPRDRAAAVTSRTATVSRVGWIRRTATRRTLEQTPGDLGLGEDLQTDVEVTGDVATRAEG